MTVLDDLIEKRKEVWDKQKGLVDRADVEHRSMDGEETRQWNQWDGEYTKLDEHIADLQLGEKRSMNANDMVGRHANQSVETTSGFGQWGTKTYEQEDAELRSFLRGETRILDIPLPNGIERRSLLDSSTPLPTSFVGQLYRYLVDTSSIRQTNPTIYSTTSGELLTVPRSTAEGAAHWTAEAGNLTAGDPTLSSVQFSAYKVGKLIQVSSELLADTGFDIVGYMAESAGRNIGIAVDAGYVAGTGTTQPTGFTTTAVTALTAATGTGSLVGLPTSGTVVGADVLIELFHSILPQYRPRSSFVMKDSTVKVVRKLKDSTGQYIWQPALVAGQPDTALGRPVYADPNMPAIGASNTPIAFGDFAGYGIRDVTPVRFQRSDDFAFGSDLVSFRAIYRTDGQQLDAQAIKLYACAAS